LFGDGKILGAMVRRTATTVISLPRVSQITLKELKKSVNFCEIYGEYLDHNPCIWYSISTDRSVGFL